MATHVSTRPRRRRRRVLWPYLYILPALCAMGFAFAYPLVQVVRDSFYAGSFASPIWVGLDNYKGVIDDPEFRTSLLNNVKLMLAVPVMLGLGLAIALVLNDRIRGGRHYQSVIFLPYVLPAVAIGGINSANYREALGAGASGIAVIRAIFAAADPERAARELSSATES